MPQGDLVFDVNESIHFEKHKIYIETHSFKLIYFLNGVQMLRINDLNLLSIERQRTLNDKLSTDSTFFAEDGEDLFME